MNKNHERLIEGYPTRSYLFAWRVGQQVRTADGALYVVTGVPADDQHVLIQKLALDRAKRPLRGLREGRPFTVRAERDAVKVGRDCWARRVEEVERC
jgi:hypothetical protein